VSAAEPGVVPGARLQGRVAVVTGGSSGMGQATVRLFARHGAHVVFGDLDAKGAVVTRGQLEEDGLDGEFVPCDVAREDDVARLVDQAVRRFGGVDVLANVAGTGGDRAKMGSFDSENWRRVMAVNADGPFYACKYAIPQLLERGGGAIVNVASAAGVVGSPFAFPYTAAKHALVGLTRSLALTYGKKNIRVNCVCPGITETPMFTWRYAQPNAEELVAPFRRLTPIGRFGTAAEIAAAILYFASDDAAFCSGAVLSVDGGYAAQ
jgi:NAD(P)-dependent dehydrogenase (short-subunit alcohol dehydrogenase family)